MSDNDIGSGARYAGFISYSQKDKVWAKRIHKALETYRLPIGLPGEVKAKNRLGRFFRDDDELSGAPSLGDALDTAIDSSNALIVICSPHAAQSKWVDAEIRRFKRRGKDAKVLAIIVGGRPDPKNPSEQCFPPSLLVKVNPDGSLTDQLDEPLAPDVNKDSFSRLITRVVAGLIGVEFDTLWQREKRRVQKRRLFTGLAAAALMAAAFFGFTNVRGANNEKLVQESIAFAGEAHKAMDEGRVGDAFGLALQAMPASVDKPSRPVTPQAETVLRRLMADNPARGILARFDAPISMVHRVDENRLAVQLETGEVHILDTKTGAIQNSLPRMSELQWLNTPLAGVVMRKNEGGDVSGELLGQSAQIYDLSSGQIVRSLDIGPDSWDLMDGLSPSGQYVMAQTSGETDYDLAVFKTRAGDSANFRPAFTGAASFIPKFMGTSVYFPNEDTVFLSWGFEKKGLAMWRFKQGTPQLIFSPEQKLPCAGATRQQGPWYDEARLSSGGASMSLAQPAGNQKWCVSHWDAKTGARLSSKVTYEEPVKLENKDSGPSGAPLLAMDYPALSAKGYFNKTWQPYCSAFYIKSIDPQARISACAKDNNIIVQAGTGFAPHSPLRGHESSVTSLAMNAKSGQLWSGSEDGTIRLWQLPKTKPTKVDGVGSFVGHGRIALMTQAENGSMNGLNIYHANDMEKFNHISFVPRPEPTEPEADLKISEDIQTTLDEDTKLTPAQKQALIEALLSETGSVHDFIGRHGGGLTIEQMFVVTEIQELAMFDNMTSFYEDIYEVMHIQILSGGKTAVIAEGSGCEKDSYCPPKADSRLTLLDVSSGKALRVFETVVFPASDNDSAKLAALLTSPDGKELAVRMATSTLIVDTGTGKTLAEYLAPPNETIIAAAHADSSWWFLSRGHESKKGDQQVSLLRTKTTGALEVIERHKATQGKLVSSASGDAFIAQYIFDDYTTVTMSVFTKASGLVKIELPAKGAELAFVSKLLLPYAGTNQSHLILASGVSEAYRLEPPLVVDTKTGTFSPFELPELAGPSQFNTLIMDPKDRAILIVDNVDRRLRVASLNVEAPYCASLDNQDAEFVAISPGGKFIAIAYDKKVSVYDLGLCVQVRQARYTENIFNLDFVDVNHLWVKDELGNMDIIRFDHSLEKLLSAAQSLSRANVKNAQK